MSAQRAIAVITARGGSKRLPRKNIRLFSGSPIIKFSIDAALRSRCFDEVMVSTEDDEIAALARKFGALTPFKRSAKNADDFATTADVLEEVLLQYKDVGKEFTYCCCLYPTAPFVTPKRLQEALSLLIETEADSVFPVSKYSYPIQRSLKIVDGKIEMNWPEFYNSRSQDLWPAYHDAGQFYFVNVDRFLRQKKLYAKHTVPLIVSENEVQDIDTEVDWKLAELKYSLMIGHKNL